MGSTVREFGKMHDEESLDWPKISYQYGDVDRYRFVQYAKDSIPKWATNIRPEPTDREAIKNAPNW